MLIHVDGAQFKDTEGRTIQLRGVNLGGSSKLPYTPDGATHITQRFFEHRQVSFVGRPFPLDEADEHLARLRAWGFNCLRLVITWEAIEHAGPGQYDLEYLDYLQTVAEKAYEYGFYLFIDPHQDVWSRFTGGDGAPGWTLEAAGLDMRHFQATGAAIVHQTYGDPFPRMIWPSNYFKLATATMFTLFYGGEHFAPRTLVDGENIQHYLQRHYIAAIQRVAQRLKGMPHVIGYGTMNEPSQGYIGWQDLSRHEGRLQLGLVPTPLDAMALGCGFPRNVDSYDINWMGVRHTGIRRIDPRGARAWASDQECVWMQNGVWDVGPNGKPRLLKRDHFARYNGRPVDFATDYLGAFALRFGEAIRSVHEDALIFFEPDALGQMKIPQWKGKDVRHVVYAPHWYDGLTLFTKFYNDVVTIDSNSLRPVIGRRAVRRSFVNQLKRHRDEAREHIGEVPVLIGEIGIPYDMHRRRAYITGDFSQQTRAADASLRALDANMLHYTWWNYTADNNNARGDQWNGEDLSIFSRDQQNNPADINSGGRALDAIIRPYARATAGRPIRMHFDTARREFVYIFQQDPSIKAPTELYVPDYHYGEGCIIDISDGHYEHDQTHQCLIYTPSDKDIPHIIRIRPAKEFTPPRGRPYRKWLIIGLMVATLLFLLRRMRR